MTESPGKEMRRQIRRHLLFLRESGVTALAVPRRSAGARLGASLGPGIAAPGADPELELAALRAEIGDCTRCRLCEKRTQLVFGTGNARARLMFVGEGPGYEEDRQGIPFVGRAGQLLNRIIEAMKMRREDVYIANVVKCRPPENRAPLPDESATCLPFLRRQIGTIRPAVVCALGGVAVQALLETPSSISRVRGVFQYLPDGTPVMPTFHPAYLLRNPEKKKEVWEDMKKVLDLMARKSPS
jgi:uracil-DNA glycosylase family 4